MREYSRISTGNTEIPIVLSYSFFHAHSVLVMASVKVYLIEKSVEMIFQLCFL
jgi:hypothetical protein